MDKTIAAVLFDLDGTLLDTAQDMGNALNRLLLAHGRAAMPLSELRPHVSQGAGKLICVGFDCAPETPEMEYLLPQFLAYYAADLSRHTGLFAGMEPLLQRIENQPMPWGIVTNKPAHLTLPLLQALQLRQRAACVVSGDTLATRKPHPAPMRYASKQIGVPCQSCLYIGDDRRDIEAGRSAGMYTLAAAYGYIGADDSPGAWQADGVIHSPQEIHAWLD